MRDAMRRRGAAKHLARRSVALLAVVAISAGCGGEQSPKELSASELRTLIEAEVSNTFREKEPPGISVAAVRNDGRVVTVMEGVERLGGKPVTPESAFAAGSVTKPFVAATVLRLVEDNMLRLDDPIARWLPEVPSSEEITIRQLLSHTSGLEWDNGTWEQWYRNIVGQPGVDMPDRRRPTLVARPGDAYAYDNGNYLLLAHIVEQVTDQGLGEAIRSRFLDPFELTRTFVQPDEKPEPPIAHGYDRPSVNDYDWPGEQTPDGDVDVSEGGQGYVPSLGLTSRLRAPGGMASTPTDLATWARELWGGDVLDVSSKRSMFAVSDGSTRTEGPPGFDGYGLGVVRTRLGDDVLWNHGGGITGFRSLAGYLPSLDLSFAVMVNTSRDDLLVGELVQAILQRLGFDAPEPIVA